MEDPFYVKYLKYKMKYLSLKKELEGGTIIRTIPGRYPTHIVEDMTLNKRVIFTELNYNRDTGEREVRYTLDENEYILPINDNILNKIDLFDGRNFYIEFLEDFLDRNEGKYLISDYYNVNPRDVIDGKLKVIVNKQEELIDVEKYKGINDGQYGAITGTMERKDFEMDINLINREITEELGYIGKKPKMDICNLKVIDRIDEIRRRTINLTVFTNNTNNILACCYNQGDKRKSISFITVSEEEIKRMYGDNGRMFMVDRIGGLAFIPVEDVNAYYRSIFYPRKIEFKKIK